MNAMTDIVTESGAEIDVPLNKLKKSPKNVRKVPHSQEAIDALAASIGAKRMLAPLVVEPEVVDGAPTGCYLVTIGEGRRLAQRLRAKRKQRRPNPSAAWSKRRWTPMKSAWMKTDRCDK